jgi:hypothetical protein
MGLSKNMLLLKILLIGLLVFFPFAEVLRISLGNNINFTPIDLLSVLLAVWTTVMYLKNRSFWPRLKLYYFLFPAFGLISLLINSFWLKPDEFFAAFLYLTRWVSYMSIFFALLPLDDSFKKKIIKLLVVDGLIVILAGYIQYLFYSNLGNLSYLGWDNHLYRLFSTFLDPNFVGTFFVLYILFIAGLFFPRMKKYGRKKIAAYSLLLVVTLVAIILTFSRSALVMLIVSGITFFIMQRKKKYILVLLGILVIFVIVISPFFYLENVNLFRRESSIERFGSIYNALIIIRDHPILGVGFNSYRYAQIQYHFINPTHAHPSNAESGADTSLLFVFATTGIPGLISYCFLWYRLMQYAYRKYKVNQFALVFFASGIGLLVNSLFINSLFYAEIMMWIWMMAALMYKK